MIDGWVYVVEGEGPEPRRLVEEVVAERGPSAVRSFPNLTTWLAGAKKLVPGCVILDLDLHEPAGVRVLDRMHDRAMPHHAIVLLDRGDVRAAVIAMRAGAADCLEKPVAYPTLHAALVLAFGRLQDRIEQNGRRRDAAAVLARLSRREQDIVMALVAGLPNKVIAFRLGLSVRTVEVHRANIMEKTGARSLAELLWTVFVSEVPIRTIPQASPMPGPPPAGPPDQ